MIVVLTVMSGMDPHTIRVIWDGTVGKLGASQSCFLGQTFIVDSMVCSMSHPEEKSFWH
jgi:hypothetical protein